MKAIMKSDTLRRWIALLAAAILVTACGFHLRGNYKFSFNSLYIDFPASSQTARILKRQLEGKGSAIIAKSPKKADLILSAISIKERNEELTYNIQGRVREFSLHYSLVFTVKTSTGKILVEPTKISLRRTMTYDDSEILSKENERRMLFKDMYSDMAQRILRRLAVLQVPEEDLLPITEYENDDELVKEDDNTLIDENNFLTSEDNITATEGNTQFEEVY